MQSEVALRGVSRLRNTDRPLQGKAGTLLDSSDIRWKSSSIPTKRQIETQPMKAFQVKTPSGVIADGIWHSRLAIPEKIPDRFDIYFSPEDTEVIQVIIRREEYDKLRRASGCKDRVVEPAVAVPQYPELDAIVNGLVREVAIEINARYPEAVRTMKRNKGPIDV